MKFWRSSRKRKRNKLPSPSTIGSINRLSDPQKREIYSRVIPTALLDKFEISPDLCDDQGNDLFIINGSPRRSSAEISLYHQYQFPDPVLYGHITDTINEQIHILFYVLNDPYKPRYDIDRLQNGKLTQLGAEDNREHHERSGSAPIHVLS